MNLRLQRIKIEHYRSIKEVEIVFPENKPLVLFGPNNAGKSNILSAINRLLGERHPAYIDTFDSDYFQRDKESFPVIDIKAIFNGVFFIDKYGHSYNQIAIQYGREQAKNLLHGGDEKPIYIKTEDRLKYQSFLISAERNIQNAFNYGSQYTLLSKFSRKIHEALSSENRAELSIAFEQIKHAFEATPEFNKFFNAFDLAFKDSVKGFVHSLGVDFSAYDPNNYAKSMRIFAREGEYVRGFEEFGTGEQQILLMAFVKAYMQVFTSERFLLIIEEPEAHLHPLAQRWLKENIVKMCSEGMQVIISTHSPDFIDVEYIDGLVRVSKINGVTRTIQLSAQDLYDICIKFGVPPSETSPDNIIEYYSTKIFPDQLKGFFAETIILVEGGTEFFSLPIYLKKANFSLAEHGIEIVNCYGKNNIPLFWRLFTAYGYKCYPIFDCDSDINGTVKTFKAIIDNHDLITSEDQYFISDSYAYFGKDFEAYFRSTIENYDLLLAKAKNEFQFTTKPSIAKFIAKYSIVIPPFIEELIQHLEKI